MIFQLYVPDSDERLINTLQEWKRRGGGNSSMANRVRDILHAYLDEQEGLRTTIRQRLSDNPEGIEEIKKMLLEIKTQLNSGAIISQHSNDTEQFEDIDAGDILSAFDDF